MKISQLKYAELFTLLAFIFLLIIFSVQGSLTEENPEPNENPRELKAKIDKLTEENDKLKAKLKEREKEFPPNIIIEGAGKYAFPSGSGGLTTNLKNFIATDLAKKIEENFNKYDTLAIYDLEKVDIFNWPKILQILPINKIVDILAKVLRNSKIKYHPDCGGAFSLFGKSNIKDKDH